MFNQIKLKVHRDEMSGDYELSFVRPNGGEYALKSGMCQYGFETNTGIKLRSGRSRVITLTPKALTRKRKVVR